MTVSRRGLVLGGLAAGAAPVVGSGVAEAVQNGSPGSLSKRILKLFAGLPGTVSVKIDAPATRAA